MTDNPTESANKIPRLYAEQSSATEATEATAAAKPVTQNRGAATTNSEGTEKNCTMGDGEFDAPESVPAGTLVTELGSSASRQIAVGENSERDNARKHDPQLNVTGGTNTANRPFSSKRESADTPKCPRCKRPVSHYTSHQIKGQDSVEDYMCRKYAELYPAVETPTEPPPVKLCRLTWHEYNAFGVCLSCGFNAEQRIKELEGERPMTMAEIFEKQAKEHLGCGDQKAAMLGRIETLEHDKAVLTEQHTDACERIHALQSALTAAEKERDALDALCPEDVGPAEFIRAIRTRTEKMAQALREAQVALHDAWCEPDFHRTPCERATAALEKGE